MPLRLRNGVFYFRKSINGERTEECLHTSNRKVAERLAAQREVELYERKGGKSYTFRSWWNYFQRVHLTKKGVSARSGYKRTVEPLLDEWGAKELRNISPKDCAEFVGKRLLEKAPHGTIATERGYLKAMFKVAEDEGAIVKSPWTGKSGLKVVPRNRVLTFAEEALLLENADPLIQDVVKFLLATGLRVQELLSATPSSLISLPAKGIKVLGKGSKIRVVPLMDDAVAIAERILPLKATESLLIRRLQKAQQAAGIPHLTLHDLRRTFGTRCAENGMPIAILSEIMGHSNITITAKCYIHITSMTAFEAMKKLGHGRAKAQEGVKTPEIAEKNA